jgi:hypothetical protein
MLKNSIRLFCRGVPAGTVYPKQINPTYIADLNSTADTDAYSSNFSRHYLSIGHA